MPKLTLNAGHPLLANVTRLWLPAINPTAAGGLWVPSHGLRGAQAKVVGASWRGTAYGLGLKTDNGAYVDVGDGGPLSWFIGTYAVAYCYRFDNSGSQETGILISDGGNGHVLRHNGTNLQFLKSHVVSIASASVGQPATDSLHTAIFTVSPQPVAAVQLFYDGQLVATASTSQAMNVGTTTTALGMDFASPNEFGRHTILGAAFWSNRVLSAQDAWDFDQAARQRFAPLFVRPLFRGDGLGHVVTDRTGSATAGVGLGASMAPEPWTTQGFGLGIATDPEPYVQAGIALGSSAALSEFFGRMLAGMAFGSSPDEDRQATAGFGLGAQFTLDAQYTSAAAGLVLGARFTSDSGDLAGLRYRR